MAGTILNYKEWESPTTNKWYCNDTSDLAGKAGLWWIPARMLNMTPAEYLEFVIKNYKPDGIFHNEDCSFVGWYWNSVSQMRKFKNFINSQAKKLNFMV